MGVQRVGICGVGAAWPIECPMTLHSKKSFLKKCVLALPVMGAALFLTGCDGGPEIYAWRSEVHSPKTVTLRDTSSGEEILKVDVPVGQQLNMKFDKFRDIAETDGNDTLNWSLKNWNDDSVAGGNTLKVPPPSSRRLDVTLRPAPEQRPLDTK